MPNAASEPVRVQGVMTLQRHGVDAEHCADAGGDAHRVLPNAAI